MLPFVRMLEYGNKLPEREEIKKAYGVYDSMMYLTGDGDLYGYGNNTSGAMGSLENGLSTFTVFESNVDGVWSSCNISTSGSGFHKSITIIRKGTEMYWSGLGGLFGNTSYVSTNLYFTNCTSYFESAGIDVLQIKNISLASTVGTNGTSNSGCKCFVLMNNGDLYFMGKALGASSGLGLSENVVQSTFSLSAQNVVDIDCDVNVSVLVYDNGTVYYSGMNLRNGINRSSRYWSVVDGTNITKFKAVICGYRNAFLFSSMSDVYGIGDAASGNLSTGVTSGGSSWSGITQIPKEDSKYITSNIYSTCKLDIGAPRSFVETLDAPDNILYSSGVGTYIGAGTENRQFSLVPIHRPEISNIKLVCSSLYNSWYINTRNDIFCTGLNIPGNSSSVLYTQVI